MELSVSPSRGSERLEMLSESFWVGDHVKVLGVVPREGREVLPSRALLYELLIWLLTCTLYNILRNKLVNISALVS